MKINNFFAENLHGYLNFDIPFHKDLNFLTGINGSGKTTIVNCISALLYPNFQFLANINYKVIRIEINNNNEKYGIWSTSDENIITLGIGETNSTPSIKIEKLNVDDLFPNNRNEKETDYYREIEAKFSNNPILKKLKSLPSPLVLGIERRSRYSILSDERFFSLRLNRTIQRRRSANEGYLGESLLRAADIAERSYRKLLAEQKELAENLQKQIILSSLKYEPRESIVFESFDFPKIKNKTLDESLPLIVSTFEKLGLQSQEVRKLLKLFNNNMNSLAKQLIGQDSKKIIVGKDEKLRKAYFEWAINLPQINKISEIFSLVEDNIDRVNEKNRPIEIYLNICNKFFIDSKKKLFFDETGSLNVQLNEKAQIPITSLSSGERQIFVILTHLSFNPAIRDANVFVIDEPELSLHLHWQELFVDAIQEVSNKELQMILATHSPSIILDKLDNCIDISKMQK